MERRDALRKINSLHIARTDACNITRPRTSIHIHTHIHTYEEIFTLHKKHIYIIYIYMYIMYRYLALCTTIIGTKKLLEKAYIGDFS